MSRLDRTYGNWHACDELDHRTECVAGAWLRKISDHRPLMFARRACKTKYSCMGVERPIPAWIFEHESWMKMIKEKHLDLMLETGSCSSHIELQLLKKAIRHVSVNLARTHSQEAVTHKDRVACAISYLRSAERGDVVGQLRQASRYKHLSSLTDPADPFLRESHTLNLVRDHVVDLSSMDIVSQIQALNRKKLDGFDYRCQKEQLLVRFKRLTPGNTSGLNALEDAATGGIVTDPRGMAKALTEHWGNVLTAKPINKVLLQKWLDDLHDKLPTQEDHSYILTNDHILEAVRRSHETAPGPDGIPYRAYKKLGNYAAQFLLDAAEDLQDIDACPSDLASFNHALPRCLPKSPSRNDPEVWEVFAPHKTRHP